MKSSSDRERSIAANRARTALWAWACALLLLAACGGDTSVPAAGRSPAPAPVVRARRPPALRPAARPANPPRPELLAAARAAMDGGGRESTCGPYRLLTDSRDAALLDACARIGERLDATYAERFGIAPSGRPAEAIVLFRTLAAFRVFVARDGRLPQGYAGFASDVDGLLVFHAGKGPSGRREAISTLAHEMTHLASRRALGTNLPPWLSEGLADAIGDTATIAGIGPLAGFIGVETQVERLRSARARGWARPWADLVALPRSGFDRGVRSFDYEQSALLVRYLLLDPHLAPRFRDVLGRLAAGERDGAEGLARALGLTWDELDRGFAAWLRAG